jgi:hypothetical protein
LLHLHTGGGHFLHIGSPAADREFTILPFIKVFSFLAAVLEVLCLFQAPVSLYVSIIHGGLQFDLIYTFTHFRPYKKFSSTRRVKRLDVQARSPFSFGVVITPDYFMVVCLVLLVTLSLIYSHGVIALLLQGTLFVTAFAEDKFLLSTRGVIPQFILIFVLVIKMSDSATVLRLIFPGLRVLPVVYPDWSLVEPFPLSFSLLVTSSDPIALFSCHNFIELFHFTRLSGCSESESIVKVLTLLN